MLSFKKSDQLSFFLAKCSIPADASWLQRLQTLFPAKLESTCPLPNSSPPLLLSAHFVCQMA